MTRFLLFLGFAVSSAACASILDFQESTARVSAVPADDASTMDASVEPVPSATDTDPSSASPGASDGGSPATSDASEPPSNDVSPGATAPACSCVATAPDGWQGPFVVAETSGDTAPECTGAYGREVYFGHDGATAPAARCSCACGAPSGASCSTPATALFADRACATIACQLIDTALSCSAMASYACGLGSGKARAVTVGASVATGGACAPSASVVVPPVTWSSSLRLCASSTAPGLACAGGTCEVKPSPVFAPTNRCVLKSGLLACPPAYPVNHSLGGAGTDTRSCSACSCGAATGVSCPAAGTVFDDASCSVPDATTSPSACVTLGSASYLTVTAPSPRGGACLPSGGDAIGGYVEAPPTTTVCCLE